MTKTKRSPRLLTDAEEADIQRQIAADPDDSEASDTDLAQAMPFAEAFPQLAENIKRSRGRPKAEDRKLHVSLRLSPDVLAKFKATGPGWQSRIDEALRKAKV